MSNTAPFRADPVVVFPLSWWCPPQETSQPHPPQVPFKDYQQCSLSLVVNSVITNLASILLNYKQHSLWSAWITIGFVTFTCHTFSSYSFGASWTFHIVIFLNCIVCWLVLYPVQGSKWLLIWPQEEEESIVDVPYWETKKQLSLTCWRDLVASEWVRVHHLSHKW